MPGRKSKSKGYRAEREIVLLHKEIGINAERIPLSGSVGGSFSGDIIIADEFKAEVKARKSGSGFTMIEKWMGDNDILFLRRDRQEPVICMPWTTYKILMIEWRNLNV